MDALEESRRPRKLLLIGVPLVLVGIAIAAWMIYVRQGRAMLAAEIAAFKEIGGSDDYADFVPPPVPDSENAALVYLEAIEKLPAEDEDDDMGFSHGEGLPLLSDHIRAKVEASRESLDLVLKGATMPRSRLPGDYSGGFMSALERGFFGKDSRPLARRVVAAAQIAVADGEPDEAVRLIRALLAFGLHAGKDINIIAQFARMDSDHHALEALRLLLADQDVTCESLRPLLDAAAPRADLCNALLAETAGFIDDLHSGVYREAQAEMTGFFGDRDCALGLRVQRRLIQQLRLPHFQQAAWLASQPPVTQREQDAFDRLIVFSSHSKTDDALLEAESYIVLAKLAIDLRIYRRAHGEYPKALTAHTVAAPVDPATGQPVSYERTESGFLIKVTGGVQPIEWQWK